MPVTLRGMSRDVRVGRVRLDSSCEALFWGTMRYLKIPCQPASRTKHGVARGEGDPYVPEFIVRIQGIPIGIEIKGSEDDLDVDCWEAWRSKHGELVVLDSARLGKLRTGTKTQIEHGLVRWSEMDWHPGLSLAVLDGRVVGIASA